jgi:hypothetical protein
MRYVIFPLTTIKNNKELNQPFILTYGERLKRKRTNEKDKKR